MASSLVGEQGSSCLSTSSILILPAIMHLENTCGTKERPKDKSEEFSVGMPDLGKQSLISICVLETGK